MPSKNPFAFVNAWSLCRGQAQGLLCVFVISEEKAADFAKELHIDCVPNVTYCETSDQCIDRRLRTNQTTAPHMRARVCS
jgi:hypothetical protein